MIDFKKKQRTFEPGVVFKEVYGVLNTDSYSLTAVSILLFPEGDKHPFSILRTWLQDIIFDSFVDLFLSLVRLCLQSRPKIVFFLDFFNS